MPNAMVTIWEIDAATGHYDIDRMISQLSTLERSRANRLRDNVNQTRFIIYHYATRAILAERLGAKPAEIEFGYGAFGKPGLSTGKSRQAIWFNLTHSDGKGLLAVSTAGEVGIDIEKMPDDLNPSALSETICSNEQIAELLQLPAELRRIAIIDCWTRKEAFVKAIGAGLQISPRDISVSLDPRKTSGAVVAPWLTGCWQYRALTVAGPYRATVSTACRTRVSNKIDLWKF